MVLKNTSYCSEAKREEVDPQIGGKMTKKGTIDVG